MARTRFKCLYIFCCLFVSVSMRSLPLIPESTSQISITNAAYKASNKDAIEDATTSNTRKETVQEVNYDQNTANRNFDTYDVAISNMRPGQSVRNYTIKLRRDGDVIRGEAIIDVVLTTQTAGDFIKFHAAGLDIGQILVGVVSIDNLQEPRHRNVNNDVLEIGPRQERMTSYIVVIEYTAPLRNDGTGIFLGEWDDNEYIAMNLHPTNARRVFPCMDEPNLENLLVSLTFEDMGFDRVLTNSQLVEGSTTTFRSLSGSVHRWAMVAHDMNILNQPVVNHVFLYGRQGTDNQHTQASVAINHYYSALNEWTAMEHNRIIVDQDGALHVMAVPDVDRDWYGLSTLCIWEPYILMENNNAVKQRKTALVAIAEGMARQWFGWVIFPENWSDQWVISGLASYAAYEIVKDFQTPAENQEDNSLIDMNTIFTTDVIQESLLRDAYAGAQPLRLNDPIFNENNIRLHIQGLLKTKAPAILRMARLVLHHEQDIVQIAAQRMLVNRRNTFVRTGDLYQSLGSSADVGADSGLEASVQDFLRPWVDNSGYPVINIIVRRQGIQITQERFGFTQRQQIDYLIPLTFTTSSNADFDNIFPNTMMRSTTMQMDLALDDDEWIIFNLQGQGYYRVNYEDTWDRLIGALSNPEARDEIHHLNRASLLDDALNLARAEKIGYDIALEIALTMEHETEYAVWKAFVRNMEFIRKRLVPFVENEERDDNIYLRLLRRTIETVEEEIGFEPEAAEPAMISLTRGLVMEHACKVGYEPCVAAAVDIFFDPNDLEAVNPNIPPEIRPAVYCTMIREDNEEGEVKEALERHLNEVRSRYERLVILESFACSEDGGFIDGLLGQTISNENEYNLVLEERSKIFAAVASSSPKNSGNALNFLIRNAQPIREMYGGPERLEEAIFIIADNIVDGGQTNQFNNWVNSQNSISNLDDSLMAAERARERIHENLVWAENNLEEIYEWINENDASSLFASTVLLCISMCIALFN